MPLEFNQSALLGEGKEVSKFMELLYTCIKLIQDESVVQELQNLIKQYDLGRYIPCWIELYTKSLKREGKIRNYT
jgi:hypothetical protein